MTNINNKRGVATAKGAVPQKHYDKQEIDSHKYMESEFAEIKERMITDTRYIDAESNISRINYRKTCFYKHNMKVQTTFGCIDIIHSLSAAGFKLFKYIVTNIDKDSNAIYLPPDILKIATEDKTGNHIRRTVKELVDKKLIARSKVDKDIFVINHEYFFVGNINIFQYNYNELYGNKDNK